MKSWRRLTVRSSIFPEALRVRLLLHKVFKYAKTPAGAAIYETNKEKLARVIVGLRHSTPQKFISNDDHALYLGSQFTNARPVEKKLSYFVEKAKRLRKCELNGRK